MARGPQAAKRPSPRNAPTLQVSFWQIKIAALRKSRKRSALAISATARLCSASDRFAAIDVVPRLAARETTSGPENFQ